LIAVRPLRPVLVLVGVCARASYTVLKDKKTGIPVASMKDE